MAQHDVADNRQSSWQKTILTSVYDTKNCLQKNNYRLTVRYYHAITNAWMLVRI
jgi:hypothetical protein